MQLLDVVYFCNSIEEEKLYWLKIDFKINQSIDFKIDF